MNTSEAGTIGAVSTSLRLQELRSKLGEIASRFDGSERVVYFDYPVQLNLGDLLINLGTEVFFQEYKINVWKRYYLYDFPARIRGMDDDVVIACQGGGNFGDVWPVYQQQREALLARYPRNRFVVLPQTCYFSSERALAESAAKLCRHNDLHIFVRDFMSQQRLQRAGLPDVGIMPDMAHMLFGVLQPDPNQVSSGALRLIRTDRESATPLSGDGPSKTAEAAVDWQDIIGRRNASMANFIWKSMTLQRTLGMPGQKSRRWYWIRDRVIKDGVSTFSQYSEVYTDRLHAMILALLLGRRVHLKDNSYGKVSTYYRTWLQDIDSVFLE
jgi:pyruvyl transferase EpsO